MPKTVIALNDSRASLAIPPPSPSEVGAPLGDTLGRPLRDLRISVTDRCNFRCPYCMPSEIFGPGHAFLRDPQLLDRILADFERCGWWAKRPTSW